MPSLPSGLPRSVLAWLSQLSVSVGATLIATLIYAALPKVSIPPFSPPPEMTSGGKFAARVPPSVTPLTFDGLDTMPVPRVAVPTPVVLVGPVPGMAEADPVLPPVTVSPAAAPVRSLERPVRPARPLHPSLRAEVRRSARLAAAPLPAASEPVVLAASDEVAARVEDGWLPRALATARNAWSATAETSTSLLARVVRDTP